MLNHAQTVGLANTEEFTFRSFFMIAAAEILPNTRFQTEWSYFDLLVQSGDSASLIEFKYYIPRRTYRLDGGRGSWKGGASKKNESEFWSCVDKLRANVPKGIEERRLVLVYLRDDDQRRRLGRSFHSSYGQLGPSDSLARVWSFSEGPLEARVLEPAAAE